MLFNSFEYAIFLPVIFLIYWMVIKTLQWQNLFLLGISYFFYAWWDWRFLSLLVLSSTVDFLIGQQFAKETSPRIRKRYLFLSLFTNLGILGFFKYYNFFVQELVNAVESIGLSIHTGTLNVILPVGISFYTFQTLSYTIDVYRQKIKPVNNWITFFAYVSFFPQLVAGPIERAGNLIPQFNQPRTFKYLQARDGMQQILGGLFKKIVIADNCAVFVDATFANYAGLEAGSLILGIFLFAIQIYCDFSGYSDIAIGTARLLGFNLMRNFAFPYFSRDIAEFWRRWHISLSTWFRDYVYIPLGGSRVKSKGRLVFNVAAIFLISGFWHGANWTFIIWGAIHALYFIPNILMGKNRRYLDVVALGKILPSVLELWKMSTTFFLVCLAWVFFRAESVTHAFDYLFQVVNDFDFAFRPFRKQFVLLLGVAALFLMEWLQRNKEHALQLGKDQFNRLGRMVIYVGVALSIILFVPKEQSMFIYFQF